MKCRQCGTDIFIGNVCPNCNTVNYPENTQQTQNYNVQQTVYGMKWYKFLIYFFLFLGAILNLANAISYFQGSIYAPVSAEEIYKEFPGMRAVDIFAGAMALLFAVFCIVTRFALARYKKIGPKLICAYYIATAIFNVVYVALASVVVGTSLFNFAEIVSFCVSAGMAYANYVYFKNREGLFVN